MSNLTVRVLFAIVAIPIMIGVAYAGGLLLAVVLGLVSALAAWEFYRLAAQPYEPMVVVGVGLAFILPLGVHGYRTGQFAPPVFALGAVIVLVVFALAIFARGANGHPIGASATTVFGVVYTAGMLSFAYGLRYDNYAEGYLAGTAVLAFPLALTWISDSAGFFVGKAIGRHRLIPSVSPGKTVEGAVGALVLTGVASWAYAHWVLPWAALLAIRPSTAVVIGVVVSLAVQLGDLAESLIKREAGQKDSSHLVPGHGGVLDRIDGLLFALPVMYLALTFPHVLVPAFR